MSLPTAAAILGAYLLAGNASLEQTQLAARAYHVAGTTALKTNPGGIQGASYSAGSLWLLRDGLIRRFDSKGEEHLHTLPDGVQPLEIWPHGPSVTVLASGEDGQRFVTVSDNGQAAGTTAVLAGLSAVVPLDDGYVGLTSGPGGRRLEHVSRDGKRWQLCFDPPVTSNESAEEGGRHDRGSAAAPECGARSAPTDGTLSRLDAERVAYVVAEPYEIWIFGANGSTTHLVVDDSAVLQPEQTSYPQRKDLLPTDLEVDSTRVESAAGRVIVGRWYRMKYELRTEVAGRPAGSEAVGFFQLIDFIDEVTGKVVERVDVSAIDRRFRWVGLRGADLVFTGYRSVDRDPAVLEQFVAFASSM